MYRLKDIIHIILKDYFKKEMGLILLKEKRMMMIFCKMECVDFYSFSYYMSNCISCQEGLEKSMGNLLGGVTNPYLKSSEWGWQMIQLVLELCSNKMYDRTQKPIFYFRKRLRSKRSIK